MQDTGFGCKMENAMCRRLLVRIRVFCAVVGLQACIRELRRVTDRHDDVRFIVLPLSLTLFIYFRKFADRPDIDVV